MFTTCLCISDSVFIYTQLFDFAEFHLEKPGNASLASARLNALGHPGLFLPDHEDVYEFLLNATQCCFSEAARDNRFAKLDELLCGSHCYLAYTVAMQTN